MKIRPVGGELFHSDRRDEANSRRFSQFCEHAYKSHKLTFTLHMSVIYKSLVRFWSIKNLAELKDGSTLGT
jgi:hypothetical protein